MDITRRLNGVVSVINTPFTHEDRIDTESLSRYVEHAVRCGAVGILVPALAAEVNKLSMGEREYMVATVLDTNRGRIPVIGGASAPDQQSRLVLTRMLNALGCDGVLVSLPFTREDAFCRHIYEIAEQSPGFLMIQDWDFTGYGIPVPTFVKLFEEIDLFKCLKVEVVPAGAKYTEVLEATGGRLHVSGGWASSQMIEGLDRGVNAFMSTILPDVYAQIYRLHRAGEREAAKQLFSELVPILAFSHQHLDISIHFNKRLVHRQGLFSTSRVRQPILPFDAYHERVADELIDHALALSHSLTKAPDHGSPIR